MIRIVLDTNCLIASLSRTSKSYEVWKGLYEGRYILCVSNEILMEYQEIISQKTTSQIAENVIQFLINCEHVEFITPYFHFELIKTDLDDNKFVDCAIAANATYIVSEDNHYKPLKDITYPHLIVIKLMKFVDLLRKEYGIS
ncbi:MAG: putative toxin-antitoxin system toxin component, PIN family [Bacteroidaceae bacterium]|nr:putative toxin-antitoxin system toxin component, PIN family [Bacteroidaceae bacterium]